MQPAAGLSYMQGDEGEACLNFFYEDADLRIWGSLFLGRMREQGIHRGADLET